MTASRRAPEGFSTTSVSGQKLKKMMTSLGKEITEVKEPKDLTKVVGQLGEIGDVVNTAIEEYFESAPEPVQEVFKKYRIPKSTIMIASVAAMVGTLLYVAVTYGARILSYFVGVLQPLYHTFKALETEGKDDDTLWLTYWMVYGFMSFLDETVLVPVVALFPVVYYALKITFMVYIVNFNGAVVVYESALQPFFRESLEKVQEIIDDSDKEHDD